MVDKSSLRAMTYNLHLYGDANGLLDIGIGGLEYYDQQRLTKFIENMRKENPHRLRRMASPGRRTP